MDNSFELKKELYDYKDVCITANAFNKICSISISENETNYIVEIENTSFDYLETKKEFCNYLICLQNKRQK